MDIQRKAEYIQTSVFLNKFRSEFFSLGILCWTPVTTGMKIYAWMSEIKLDLAI